MSVLPQDIGKRIQVARERKDWNQSDLARALGKARQHIFMLEHGHHFPTVPVLYQIAQILEVSTDYLLGLEDAEHDTRRPQRRRPAKVAAS